MTDPLRKLFDDLVADEPPLRTTADSTVAAGRRLQRRNRTLWTAAGTALTVAAVVVVPPVLRLGPLSGQPAAGPSVEPSVSVEATIDPSASDPPVTTAPSPASTLSLVPTPYEVCPAPASTLPRPDGSTLPDPQAAMQAVLAEGPLVAPGMSFVAFLAERVEGAAKFDGEPVVFVVFDVGDSAGYGSVNVEIRPENDLPPAQRADRGANVSSCVEGSRYIFEDGSVAIHYPYGPPEQEATVTHVWYYAAGGFTMNIGLFPQGWPTDDDGDPETPAIPSPRPARGEMPLTIAQVMQIADAIARSG